MRNTLVVLLLMMCSLCAIVASADIDGIESIKVENIVTEVPPYTDAGTTMVPMRAIFEWLGAEVRFDPATRLITATRGETTVQFRVGTRQAWVNDTETTMSVPSATRGNITFVPLRFVSEAMGSHVIYDAPSAQIIIYQEGKAGILSLSAAAAPPPENIPGIETLIPPPDDNARLILLDSPKASELLARDYPVGDCTMFFGVTFRTPGVIIDTVGINGAPVGSFSLNIDAEGRVTFQVYDPGRQSAGRIANGWHLLTSDTCLTRGVEGVVNVTKSTDTISLRVNNGPVNELSLATPLSGQPVYAGDFPGDDHWGARYNIHPAMVGTVRIHAFGKTSIANLPPVDPPDDPVILPDPPTTQHDHSGTGVVILPGDILASGQIGPAGGTVQAPGKCSVTFPPGALSVEEKIVIRDGQGKGLRGAFYFIERTGGGALLAKPALVTFTVPAGVDPRLVVPATELQGTLWTTVTPRYDAAARTLTIEQHHFSGSGYFSDVTASDIRKVCGAALGGFVAAGAIVVITGSSVITIPAAVIIGGTALLAGTAEIANPLVEQGYRIAEGINAEATFGDWLTMAWVDNPKSTSHLGGESFLVCLDRQNRVVFWMDAAIGDQRTAAIVRSLVPFATHRLLNVPKSLLHLAAELTYARNYYTDAGYTLPDHLPVWVYRSKDDGGWDGVKMVVNVKNMTNKEQNGRQATVAHELWHAVYQKNEYAGVYPWFDECMAVAYESEVFPATTLFWGENPASEIRVVQGTGMVFTGVTGTDAHKIKRGYKLWPWGKFLLHTQGHSVVREMAQNAIDAKQLGQYFVNYSRALLSIDQALEDANAPETVPGTFAIVLPPGMTADTIAKGLAPTTGWSTLTLDQLDSKRVFQAGSGKAYDMDAKSIYRTCRPLSINILTAQAVTPDLVALKVKQGDIPPFIIRRQSPEAQEQIVALHPTRKDQQTGRRAFDDMEIGLGKVAVPNDWLAFTPGAKLNVPFALVGAATQETWSQYLGFGENNLFVYLLLPPRNIQIVTSENTPSGTVAGGTINVGKAKALFSWKAPDLGLSLKADEALRGYRLFTQKGTNAPVMVKDLLFPADKEDYMIDLDLIKDTDRVGLASEDKEMKGVDGKPLLSPPAWIEAGIGSLAGVFEIPDGNNPFADEYKPKPGAALTLTLELPNGRTRVDQAVTDANGRFSFTNIPALSKYKLVSGEYKTDGRMPYPAENINMNFGGIVIKGGINVAPGG